MAKNDPAGEVLTTLVGGIGKSLKSAFYGVKKLNKPLPIIGFVAMIGITVIAYKAKDNVLTLERLMGADLPVIIRYLMYWFLLLLPLFYLIILGKVGSKQADEYATIFEEIGFIGKDKRAPYFIGKREDGKKLIYTFRSNIPVSEWKKAKSHLETGLDCNVRVIREGKGKKYVELVTVPSNYKIPEMVRWDESFIQASDSVICIGESDLDQITFDLNKTPHILVAGETGSGKSVVLRAILWQMIKKGCRIFMIDFKGGVEFGKVYERFGEVIMDRKRALAVLQALVKENTERLVLFRELDVKNLREYNNKTKQNLCRVCVILDEIAEMLDKTGVSKEEKVIFEQLEAALSTLARLARATGINLILGVQRPDAKILPGQIKNNVPGRICGRFADKPASEIVLGNTAAVDLPAIQGRFLFKFGNETTEFQSYYFDDERDLDKDFLVEPGEMLTEKNDHIPKTINKANVTVDKESAPAKIKLDLNFEE